MDLTKREDEQLGEVNLNKPNEQPVENTGIDLNKPVENTGINLSKTEEAEVHEEAEKDHNLDMNVSSVNEDKHVVNLEQPVNQGLSGLGQMVGSANIGMNNTQPMNEGYVDPNAFNQEQVHKEPNVIDEYGQKINNYIENNDTFKKVEKAATDIGEQLSQELNKAVDGLQAGVAGMFNGQQVNQDLNGQNFQSQGNNEQYQGNFQQQSVNLSKEADTVGVNFEKFKDNSHNKFEAKYKEMNRNGKVVTPDKLSLDPIFAVLVSFFLPGLGQMINGQLNKGLLMLVINLVQATVLSLCCCLGIITGLIGNILIMIDAYFCAEALKNGESLGEYEIRLK